MAQTYRTFIAVEVSSGVAAQAARLIGRLERTSAKVRWVDPRTLHLTLKFLGEVEALLIPDLCKAVSAAVAAVEGFDMELAGVGAFPNTAKPRTIWLGARQGQEEMIALHDAIDAALADLGFRSEARRFKPHLTLGRVRQGHVELSALIAEHEDFSAGKLTVDEVVVMSSELTRDGPEYTPLGHAELA